MPGKRTAKWVERGTRRVPGLRHLPVVRLLALGEIAMLAREHVTRLEPHERRRVLELLRIGRLRPQNLSASERDELHELVAKAEPRLLAGLAAEKLSPVWLPQRVVLGPKRGRAPDGPKKGRAPGDPKKGRAPGDPKKGQAPGAAKKGRAPGGAKKG